LNQKTIPQKQHIENQRLADLLPDHRDGLDAEMSHFIKERNFVFSICRGDLAIFDIYWSEKSYYEIFEKFIFLSISSVS